MKSQILLFFIATLISNIILSQDSTFIFSYEVNKIAPYLSVPEKKLKEAQTIRDLNKRFKTMWVKEYVSVEISSSVNGKIKKALSHSDTLNNAQKTLLKATDLNSVVEVDMKYIPNNSLASKDVKELNFTFSIDPNNTATFHGGELALFEYLKENAIDKINKDSIEEHAIASLKFIVNEKGQIIDAHIFQTSENEKTDAILLKAICNMPSWKPASYSNGINIKEEWALSIGDHRSCMVNVLNPYQLCVE